ncbi:hypothetical protein HS088_TW09G01030 [Tripterygium wilfordii]|uniref:Uncharacterized protein n=1 Tax=Tripterygium wilfordii TaxID=458696 RepID=A0A7J7D9L7_TRIWF|nr:uncharacterized protein LOC120006042 [Tripterygium wilfordii]KAF5742968.1 hypothetical protein HS088_TW09G01030 [Tripterygium wilfordii]
MLLRKPISNTKRFFERTIESVKSLFSCANYQKLPKSKPSPYNNPNLHPYVTVRGAGMIDYLQPITMFDDLDNLYADYTKKTSTVTPVKEKKKKKKSDGQVVYGMSERGRSCLVAEKLKELEMIDNSNVDHLEDIEELLHYHARLTCPAYRHIVDNFFFDIYSEFFASKQEI